MWSKTAMKRKNHSQCRSGCATFVNLNRSLGSRIPRSLAPSFARHTYARNMPGTGPASSDGIPSFGGWFFCCHITSASEPSSDHDSVYDDGSDSGNIKSTEHQSPSRSIARSFSRSLTPSFVHSPTRTLTRSITRSLAQSRKVGSVTGGMAQKRVGP